MGKHILVVDDDPHIRDVIVFALEQSGMEPVEAKDGDEAIRLFEKHSPDLIVLDINMPELDGMAVCKKIRKASEVPILFLSSRDEEIDRIVGLEIGGDDYVSKPFSPRELVARVHAILKRVNGPQNTPCDSPSFLERGQLRMDLEKHQCTWSNQLLEITAREFAILEAFLKFPEKAFRRDDLLDTAYEPNSFVSDRTIDSHIRHIRQKLAKSGCESVIETVRGVGYRLGSCQ